MQVATAIAIAVLALVLMATLTATFVLSARLRREQHAAAQLASRLGDAERRLKDAKRQALKALRDLEVTRKALLKQSAGLSGPRQAERPTNGFEDSGPIIDSGFTPPDFATTQRLPR